jgi:BirA family biotin operon repressor/biotin-[acetyl-CoA-carboxylase] ligase
LQKTNFPTLFTGQNLIELATVASTNTYASELLQREKPPEGTVIFTPNQTNGKGQMSNIWESEPNKNLTFSIIYYPHFLAADEQFLLNQIICIGICEYLNFKTNLKAVIKWPNDILINKQKISGILIENSLQGSRINSSIIGIGININQTSFTKTAANPTSLKLLTHQEYNLMNCLHSVCSFIEAYYLELQTLNKHPKLREKYLKMLFGFNEEIKYLENAIEKTGIIIGVTPEGRLQIKDADNEIHIYNNKEISFC